MTPIAIPSIGSVQAGKVCLPYRCSHQPPSATAGDGGGDARADRVTGVAEGPQHDDDQVEHAEQQEEPADPPAERLRRGEHTCHVLPIGGSGGDVRPQLQNHFQTEQQNRSSG
jgi:hypothetical protein